MIKPWENYTSELKIKSTCNGHQTRKNDFTCVWTRTLTPMSIRSECTLYFCSTKNSPTTRYNYNHGLWQEARICLATVSYAGWSRLRSATCGSSKEGSLKQLVASRSTQTILISVYATYYLETWFKILGTMVVDIADLRSCVTQALSS